MSEYTPDKWVILNMDYKGKTCQKVLAGWSGGYLDGDSWRINSGIETIVETDDRFEIIGYSGSVYICYKNRQGFSMAMLSVFGEWAERIKDDDTVSITVEEI